MCENHVKKSSGTINISYVKLKNNIQIYIIFIYNEYNIYIYTLYNVYIYTHSIMYIYIYCIYILYIYILYYMYTYIVVLNCTTLNYSTVHDTQ